MGNPGPSPRPVPHPTRRLAAPIAASLLLGGFTTLAVILALVRLCDPPNTPVNISRAFVRDGRAWTSVESHRFGIVRAWWDPLTRADMTLPTDKSAAAKARELLGLAPRETEDPARLIADYAAKYDELIRSRPGGRVYDTPAPWGQFALDEPLPPQQALGCDVGYGWPFIGAWYQIRGNSRGMYAVTSDIRFGHLLSGTPTARGDLFCRVLPTKPAWGGLLANTAIFAVAWLAVLLIPGFVRRTIRRRRGQCTHCAYDLRATPLGTPCPECGGKGCS
ncbi:MAG: hypothetical protein ACREJO_13670 [Phycisphaerales bacterium]